MPLINIDQVIENDPWHLISGDDAAEQVAAELTASQAIIVPWDLWVENQEALVAREADTAVLINGATNWDDFVAQLNHFTLVAIEFPSFGDGRGFSLARMLKRMEFAGEIRAVGDVTWDRLRFMKRCGFDTFMVPDDRYSDAMFAAFTEISLSLQGSADDPRPIYRQ